MQSIRTGWQMLATLGLVALVGSGCGSDPLDQTSDLNTTDTQRLDPEGYDGISPLRVRSVGLQLSVVPAVQLRRTDLGPVWELAFEANRPLVLIESRDTGGPLGQVIYQDGYHFQLRLDAAELERVLAGAPVYLVLATGDADQRRFSGMLQLAPLFVETSGSMLIWLEPSLQRTIQGAATWFRGQARVASRIDRLEVLPQVGAGPEHVVQPSSGLWRFDWSVARILPLLDPAAGRLTLVGSDPDGGTCQLETRLQLVVEQLGLTTGDPEQVWPSAR